MAASIEDVARAAGVSTATVSRALRGLPNVSPETRERVLHAALELRYVASPHAVGLAGGRTRTVGVVVPFVTRWFFGQVISGVDSVLRANGYELLLYHLGDVQGRRRLFDQMPMRKRVDALLVLCLPLTPEEVEVLTSTALPVAVVGARVPGFSCVAIDDVDGGAKAARHLLNLGHRRIGLISGTPDEPMHFTAPIDRRQGYQAALAAAGLSPDPGLEVPGHFTVEGGATAMGHLLSVEQPPTAVFAESDEMAMGALRTLRQAGLRVPQEVSVIGFDDHEMAGLMDLTTVGQPVFEQGVLAANMLVQHMAVGAGFEPDHVLVPTTVTVRGTTAPVRPVTLRDASAAPGRRGRRS